VKAKKGQQSEKQRGDQSNLPMTDVGREGDMMPIPMTDVGGDPPGGVETDQDAHAAHVSPPPPVSTTLSRLSKTYIGLLVSVYLCVLLLIDVVLGVTSLLFLFPSGLLFAYKNSSKTMTLSEKIEAYGKGMFFYGPVLNCFVGWGITVLLTFLVARITPAGASFFLLDVILIITIFVIIEEWAKYEVTRRAVISDQRFRTNPKKFVSTAMFLGAGYATAQCLLWFTFVQLVTSNVPFWVLLVEVLILSLFIVPMHLLSAYSIGLGVGKRFTLGQVTSVTQIVAPAATARALFIFVVLGPFLFHTGAALVISCVLCIVAGIAFLAFVKWQERQMPANYLAQTGYLSVMGYGALPDVDTLVAAAEAEEMTQGPSV